MLNIILPIIILTLVNQVDASQVIINNKSSATANSQNGSDATATSKSKVTINGETVTGIISSEVNGQKQEIKIDQPGEYSLNNNNGKVIITNSPKNITPSPTLVKQKSLSNRSTNNQSNGIVLWIRKIVRFFSKLVTLACPESSCRDSGVTSLPRMTS